MAMLSPFPNDAVGWLGFLLQVSARGTVVLALAALVCLALSRASAALRHLIWTLAIICLLSLPLLSVLLPSWQVRGIPRVLAATTVPMPERTLQPESASGTEATAAAKTVGTQGARADSASGSRHAAKSSPATAPAPRRPIRELIWPAALLFWAVGALVGFLYWLTGAVALMRLRRRAHPIADPSWSELLSETSAQLQLRRPVTLLRSPLGIVPMVWGWQRPVLLLPAGADSWSRERKRLVLLHELAHAKRADCLTQLLGQLARAIYWFHPLVWLALHRLRREREQACDDLVLGSGFRGSEYAGHLLSIANSFQQLALAQTVAIAVSRPAGIESRIRALLDPRRSRRGVTRPAALLAALVAAALLVALASARGASAAADADQHQPGVREQWQPQTENDPRLQQPVRIEILGRAAVPGLELLSEKTGVSLQVAPEDLETVGDRKFTVIAQGCSLKAIMVQLPKALQECHWDIDLRGEKPVYLLHRNGSAETVMAQAVEDFVRPIQEERRAAREARLAEAREALAMSSEELDELMKTDPLLAATVKEPEARHRLELLLSLPEKDMQEFAATGRAYMEYGSAPARYQQAAQQAADSFVKRQAELGDKGLKAWASVVPDVLPQAGICFEDYEDDGISLLLQYYDTRGTTGRRGDVLRSGPGTALPPQFPSDGRWFRKLLVSTGMQEKDADAVLSGLISAFSEGRQQRSQRKRALEWREPRSPQLHKIVTLPFNNAVDKVEMQRFIAKETGLSLVSDYFTTWGSGKIPEEAQAPLPVWRLLYLLGDSWFWSYAWNEAGDCLVLHDKLWYTFAPQEFPESMVLAYREKLKQQGRFTLDDVAAAAVELARRRPVPPRQRGEWPWSEVNVPSDLEQAGLSGHNLRSEAVLLYVSLSPEQRDKARSVEGLPYREMTPRQRYLVRPYAFFEGGWNHDRHPIPDEEISQAVFRIRQSTRKAGSESGESYELQVEFPSLQAGTGLWLRAPKAAAAGGS
jgi:beta-lactamase regulating signal transducer with metallopeptidase domain